MSDVWFTGPVAEAVNIVSQKNLMLLVFIYDDSEQSQQLETTFADTKLVSTMQQKTIALKMQKDSVDAKMFGQVYPISKVPLVYFILQGTVKDFGLQDLTSEDIINRINTLSPNNSSSLAVQEKLEKIRNKRAEEEKAREKEREMKRREEGKLAQEVKQSLQEKQNKAYLEKLKKEKQEDEEYKRKVKEQIAKDKADQIAARKAKTERQQQTQQASKEAKSWNSSNSASYYDHSNLNIKQLDGSSLRHNFSSSDTLATVSQWIDQSRTDGDVPFKLFAQFPNRNFDIGDEQRTLLELKLCPSGTLIMKPIKNASTAYAGSSNSSATGSSWMGYLYSAGDMVYNSVSSIGTSVASYLVAPSATAPEPGQRLGGTSGPSSSYARNSNINTLSGTQNKKDDERQTYNGNSVNQE